VKPSCLNELMRHVRSGLLLIFIRFTRVVYFSFISVSPGSSSKSLSSDSSGMVLLEK